MKILRNIIPAGLACLLLATGAFGEEQKNDTQQASQPIAVELDGRTLNFDQPPVMHEGRVLVPLRGVFESMDAQVVYNPATKTVKATGEGKVVELALGNNDALVDGQTTYMDVPARAVNGRTMVPLRFVSESLGADVRWLSANRTVAIDSPVEVAEVVPEPVEVVITDVAHNGGTLGQNSMLKVTATGTPGATANFDLLGLKDDVVMTEVAPGSYRGELKVEPGMQLANGSVVVQLTHDGKTVQQQAASSVNIDPSRTATESMTLSPAQGTLAASEKPLIQAKFLRNVRPESIKMTVDGRDVSAWTNRTPDAVTYTPDPRLTNGAHIVAVQAVDTQGNTLTEQWDFQVAGNTGDGYRPDLSVTNMTSGQGVHETFDIEGKATPNAKVQLTAIRKGSLNPQTVRVNGVADGGGNFDIEMNVKTLPANAEFDVEALAIDEEGDVSDPVVIELKRL